MIRSANDPTRWSTEADYQEQWYERALDNGFFETTGFRRLFDWNLRAFLRSVPLKRTDRVLSLGCGFGDYERAVAPRVASIVALDLSATAIGEARRRAAAEGVQNIEFRHESVGDFASEPRSFDIAYAFGLLHHLTGDDRTRLIRSVHRWLTPGGSFYARDPSGNGILRRIAEPCFRRRVSFLSPNERPIRPIDLVRTCQDAGFRDVTIEYTDVLSGPLPWLIRSNNTWLWQAVFGVDRIWLRIPGLRTLASQFSLMCRV